MPGVEGLCLCGCHRCLGQHVYVAPTLDDIIGALTACDSCAAAHTGPGSWNGGYKPPDPTQYDPPKPYSPTEDGE